MQWPFRGHRLKWQQWPWHAAAVGNISCAKADKPGVMGNCWRQNEKGETLEVLGRERAGNRCAGGGTREGRVDPGGNRMHHILSSFVPPGSFCISSMDGVNSWRHIGAVESFPRVRGEKVMGLPSPLQDVVCWSCAPLPGMHHQSGGR